MPVATDLFKSANFQLDQSYQSLVLIAQRNDFLYFTSKSLFHDF